MADELLEDDNTAVDEMVAEAARLAAMQAPQRRPYGYDFDGATGVATVGRARGNGYATIEEADAAAWDAVRRWRAARQNEGTNPHRNPRWAGAVE